MATSTLAVNRPGFYGPVTSTLDWCEANYQFSYYVAEMANAFSNFFSIGLALLGIINVFKQGLPSRYAAGFGGFLIVGVGSFAFHATLLFHYQLADELPMIYAASSSIWFLYDLSPGFHITNRATIVSFFIIIVFDTLFSWSYIMHYRNPVYHQTVFGAITLATAVRIAYLLKYSSARHKISDEKRTFIANSFATGALLFTFAFVLWNLDNIFCDLLTNYKTTIGWPLAFLLEGHSWWHVFTGAGTYFMFVGIQFMSICIKGGHEKFEVQYSYGLPLVCLSHKKQ